MRNFIKKMIMMIMAVAAFFFATPAMAQKVHKSGKISAATRLVIKDRDGGMSLEAPQELKHKKTTTFTPDGQIQETPAFGDGTELPFATPKMVNGLEMVQCWIEISDKDYSQLEAFGVKIQTKFKDRVTALVPSVALEKVAELGNISKVSVAKKLKKNTYVSRILTNVDDVLNYSADAQAAGLLQAYNGSGVVLGIIDTGIDFGHQMFNGRIKKKYVYNTTAEELQEYTGNSVYYTDETHGTHTSTIAGGSDYTATAYVYTTSTSYTTVNNAKFGGMAPGTDLVLCDLGEELTDANIAACIKYISDYADQVGKPCVTSLSLGGHYGPHDGTGDMADVCAQYTGAGKIIVFAAGNEGEDNIYLGKNASSSSPAMTVLTSQTRSSYSMDYGATISYARTPNVELAATYYVVNTSTNQILWTSDEVDTEWRFVDDDDNVVLYGREISVNDVGADGTTKLSNYFTAYNNDSENYGYLCCYMEQDTHNDKWNIETDLFYLVPRSNNYKIGVSIYPKTGTCYVDSWPVAYIDFTASSATVNGNRFTAGSNECSISDEGTYPSVVSVGAYVSSKYWRAGTTSGSTQSWSNNGTYQQISMFSSYQAPGYGPLGTKLPWITAPGEVILAGYNSGYSAESNYYYAYGTNKVLGAMSGTSMATPCVAGITALWLQADPTLTPEQVKEIMASTAIKDTYVTGTYASHFGNGKIDALAGIEEILANKVYIAANPQSLTMTTKPNETKTETFTVKGNKLTGNITATLSDPAGLFSISPATLTKNGGTITVTYAPTAEGNHTATITLSSAGADDVTVTINGVCNDGGTASDAYLDIAKYATINDAGWNTSYVNNLYKYTEYNTQKEAWLTLPVYGAWVGCYYNNHPQKWIKTNVTDTSNKYAGTTWSNSDVILGSSQYFTNTTARGMGYNYRYNYTQETFTFYVTNTTAVKLLGQGQSRTNSSYPATLKIYECSVNADGTLTEGTDAIKNEKNSSTSGTFTLSATGLDVGKIYKVEAATYRSYLCEIAFCTPLKSAEITATPASLTLEGNTDEDITGTFTVTGNDLEGDITATLTDANNKFSISANSITVTEATNGKNITVTFRSDVAGTFNGTVTLTSTGADNKTVTLTGIAHAPSLEADPTTLTFETKPGTPVTGTFDVIGEYLKGNVTLTLAGDAVFSINKTSIAKDNNNEVAETVTVTFSPSANGEYSGTVTLTSDGIAEPVVVTLNGSAYPDGYDVVIGSYGVTTLYVDFPLTIPYDTYDPDLLGVFVVKSAEDGEVKLNRLSSDIPANTGVVVMGNKGTYTFPRNRGEVTPLKTDNLLYGYIENTPRSQALTDFDKPNGIVMTLGKGTQGYIGFYKYTGGTLNANKAFLIYEPTAGNSNVSMLSIAGFGGDDLTGIRDLQVVSDGDWYTLQGVKLNGQPRQSGLYIHNGKTVVVK